MRRAGTLRRLLAIPALLYRQVALVRSVSAIPRAAIDPYARSAGADLRELFRSVADGDGLLRLHGLSRALDLQRRADGAEPLPQAFVSSLLRAWGGEAGSKADPRVDEEQFVRGYGTYFMLRHWMLNEWQQEAAKHRCFAQEGAARACCDLQYGPRGYEPCWVEEDNYTFERCCRAEALQDEAARRWSSLQQTGRALRWDASGPPTAAVATEQGHLERVCQVQTIASCTLRPRAAGPSRGRVAVLAVGVRQRYYPLTTLRHVVAPAARRGYEVDYFAMLSWRPRPPRGRLWSMHAAQGSPNPAFANVTHRALEDYVLRHARHYGARRVHVHVIDPGPDMDPLEPSWRRYLGRDTKAHPAFLGYLLRMKKIEMLWNATRASGQYSQVVLVRDDVHWVDDVRLDDFLDPLAAYSQPFGFLCSRTDPKVPIPDMPSEHVLVFGEEAAPRMLQVYSEYYGNPSSLLDEVPSVEHFWLALAQLKGVRWELVQRARLPYFLSFHAVLPAIGAGGNDTMQPVFCLRGVSSSVLQSPTDSCVHPSLVREPRCGDLL